MDFLLQDEFRLTYALLLAIAPLAGSWRFVYRRLDTDAFDRITDVLLLFFLTQYLSVTLPGLCRLLYPLTIALTTLAVSLFLWFAPAKPLAHAFVAPRHSLIAITSFFLIYIAQLLHQQAILPITAVDALTYHAPAADHWLTSHSLNLFEAWYFNPANTYSPLAGSTFLAWWMAPIGNDTLAHNVQYPALILIFFATLRILRHWGLPTFVAGLTGIALCTSQPFIRQAFIEKDDLYVVAFFLCAVASLSTEALRHPLAPWRLGISLGLLFATKYTTLLCIPLLLVAFNAPRKAHWSLKKVLLTLTPILLLAGPWYLRNLLAYGNPLFPLKLPGIPGLISPARSAQFASFAPIWSLLTQRDQSLPATPFLIVTTLWLIACLCSLRQSPSADPPLRRLILLGPPILFLLFFTTSPYAEIRFAYPAFALLYVASALAITALLTRPVFRIIATAVLLVLPSLFTGIFPETAAVFAGLALVGVTFTLLYIRFRPADPSRRRTVYISTVSTAALLNAALVYIYFPAFIANCRDDVTAFYRSQHGDTADAWQFVREKLPPDEPLAYANTFLIHPLAGFDHRRPLLYIPTRKGVTHIADLPPIPGRPTGETLVTTVAAATIADPDPAAWLANLLASPATHLIVFHNHVVPNPPELPFAQTDPHHFEPVFSNPAATVFAIHR